MGAGQTLEGWASYSVRGRLAGRKLRFQLLNPRVFSLAELARPCLTMIKESWDLYNSDFTPTGETVRRGDVIPPGRRHLVVHMWFVNSRGEFLIQQRNKPDDGTHGLWFCTGGSVLAGEQSVAAAVRETREELGLALAEKDFVLLDRRCRPGDNYIVDIWICNWDGDISSLVLDQNEVRDAKWAGLEEIESMQDDGSFWRLRDDYLSLLKTGDIRPGARPQASS